MKWRKLFGPKNSLILSYDHFTFERIEEFREELDEVGRYYEFCKLGEIVSDLRRKKAGGRVAITFKDARKSVLMLAVKELLSREIPFTLFLRPDCIGLNRLPPAEELSLYRAHYPDHLSKDEWLGWEQKLADDPDAVETFLIEARKKIGPLPVETIDPMIFFSTWGKILEVSPKFREIGLHVDVSARQAARVGAAKEFVKQQMNEIPCLAYFSRNEPTPWLANLGFQGVLVDKPGAVDSGTDPHALPFWPLSVIDDK